MCGFYCFMMIFSKAIQGTNILLVLITGLKVGFGCRSSGSFEICNAFWTSN